MMESPYKSTRYFYFWLTVFPTNHKLHLTFYSLFLALFIMPDQRLFLLKQWLISQLANQHFIIEPITGDASFRRYFRVQVAEQSFIAMDAPLDKEDCRPFVAIATAFAKLGIQVPHIFALDLSQGFLLLTDLGDRLYLNELNAENFRLLYTKALDVLIPIQTCQAVTDWPLPHFGRDFITREWQLYVDWVVNKHWHIKASVQEQHLLTNTLELLFDSAAAQPQVCVHRDYHSRNLLRLVDDGVGVLDFQDAVWGPITYDAVSLLRDCYIDWPLAQIEEIIAQFYWQLRDAKHIKQHSLEEFIRWFDLMGVQRHLKALGIFARLNYLYQRPNYLQYIPRGLTYVLHVCEKYPELKLFREFLQPQAITPLTEDFVRCEP